MLKPSGHPLNMGRLSWWLPTPGRLGGTLLYDIVGGNHATIINAPPWTHGFSNFDAAIRPDGHIAVPKYAVANCPTLSAYTIACRVTFDSLYPPDSSNSNGSLMKNWGGITGIGYFHWNMVSQGDTAPAGCIRCYVNTTDGVFTAVTANPLSVGVPYRLAVTAGDGVLKLYINGAPDGSASYTGSLTSNCSKIAFGCKLQDDQATPAATGVDNSLLAGTLGDCSLWNRALSDAEVAQLDAEMRAGYPSLLVRPRTQVSLLNAAMPPPSPSSGWLGTGYTEEDPMSITYGGWSADSAISAATVAPGTDKLGSALSLDGKAVAHLSFEYAKSAADGVGGDIILEYLKDRDGTYFETQPGNLNKQVRRCAIPGDGSTGSTTITVYASEGKAIKPRVRVLGTSATVTLRTMTGTA